MPTTIDVIEPVRTDEKNKQTEQFEYSVTIPGKKSWKYLTTATATKAEALVRIEDYHNNFSSFYVLRDDNGGTIGIIGFSVKGISLFGKDYTNQRNFILDRHSDKFQRLYHMEHRMLGGNNTPSAEDIEFLRSLWEEYNGAEDQDAMK